MEPYARRLLPALALPLDLPLPAGDVVRTAAGQGRTSISLIDVPGGTADVVPVRDAEPGGGLAVRYADRR